jgi:hypothetical protein
VAFWLQEQRKTPIVVLSVVVFGIVYATTEAMDTVGLG